MNTPEENDPLDALLSEQNPYFEDAGFTRRVVKSLPRRRAYLRPAILLGAVIIGSGLAIWWQPWGNLTVPQLSVLPAFNDETLLPWVILLSVAGSLIWGVAAALQRED